LFAVTVLFEIKHSHEGEFLSLMTANAQTSLKDEPGCRQFDVCYTPERSQEVFLYEIYDDEAAFKEHLQTPHFKSFDASVSQMVTRKTVQTFTKVMQ